MDPAENLSTFLSDKNAIFNRMFTTVEYRAKNRLIEDNIDYFQPRMWHLAALYLDFSKIIFCSTFFLRAPPNSSPGYFRQSQRFQTDPFSQWVRRESLFGKVCLQFRMNHWGIFLVLCIILVYTHFNVKRKRQLFLLPNKLVSPLKQVRALVSSHSNRKGAVI